MTAPRPCAAAEASALVCALLGLAALGETLSLSMGYGEQLGLVVTLLTAILLTVLILPFEFLRRLDHRIGFDCRRQSSPS